MYSELIGKASAIASAYPCIASSSLDLVHRVPDAGAVNRYNQVAAFPVMALTGKHLDGDYGREYHRGPAMPAGHQIAGIVPDRDPERLNL